MKQLNSIDRLKKLFLEVNGLEAAILYGSFARKTANSNSDIDIQLVVGNAFEKNDFITLLKEEFHDEIKKTWIVELRQKIVVYFKQQPKLEFSVHKDISQIERNYLGSEIKDVDHTILFQLPIIAIKDQLEQLLKYKKTHIPKEQADNLINKFLYEFESCSNMQHRSDGYQFYYFYNIALHVAVQLQYLSKGHTEFNFLPKYFLAKNLKKEELSTFYDLQGTLYLPEANRQKRRLLDFFYASIVDLVTPHRIIELKGFCEWIYRRDFFWNFRDICKHNPKIKSKQVFRTATFTFFQEEERFDELLEAFQVKTIIDLRAPREIEKYPYSRTSLAKFKYIKVPFDPWNQPDWFVKKYQYGTNEEIAYRFFILACKQEIKKVLETIINTVTGTVAIHCFAGKDRTGIIISLLHLLVDTPLDNVYADYLASEVDVKQELLSLVFTIIEEEGGIIAYLKSCGLSQWQLEQLNTKLLNE